MKKIQLDRLRSEGCTEVQGYLFSKPRPAAEIADLLQHGCEKPTRKSAA
jgi:EAL domain-containing protein (putative c-di-GMP-specific phosphodiesterase class I)